MSLEEDLKARTLALISSQMATWVVEIQRHIQDPVSEILINRHGESIGRIEVDLENGELSFLHFASETPELLAPH